MKKNLVIITVVIASIALTAGIVKAASLTVDSLTVGKQGVGGVTYFNGTIINKTTTNGVDNPVTFGDNVRIDGYVFRGSTAGSGDNKPFKINDDGEVVGNLTVGGSSTLTGNTTIGGNLAVTGSLTFGGNTPVKNKTYTGTIDITKDGDEVMTSDIADCTQYPTAPDNYKYHYYKISIPELNLDNLANIRIYYKIDSTHMAGYYPSLENEWVPASHSLTEGYIYIMYKTVYNYCIGTSTTTYYTTGEYKILLTY